MTREEARMRLKVLTDYEYDEDLEALEMGIKALEQEPCDKCEVGNPCLYCKHEFESKRKRDRKMTREEAITELKKGRPKNWDFHRDIVAFDEALNIVTEAYNQEQSSNEKILKELQIQNLLSVIYLRAYGGVFGYGKKTDSILNYIYDCEMNNLQFEENEKENI